MYKKGKLFDFWNGSDKFQKKIVDDLICEILHEHIRSMIISYDVIAEEIILSKTDDESVEWSLQGIVDPKT